MGGSYSAPPKRKLSANCSDIIEDNKNSSVVMYTTTSCGYCKLAKDLFREEGIPYLERDIEAIHKENPELASKYVAGLREITMKTTVPQIFICKNNVGGYTDIVQMRHLLHDMIRGCDPNHKKPAGKL